MPTFIFTSPEGKDYEVGGPEGATQEQAFSILQSHIGGAPNRTGSQKYADEDAARLESNQNADLLTKYQRAFAAQAGRTVLGATELLNNLTGDSLVDPEVLALAQQGADTMDRGTGAMGVVGNVLGDPLTFALGGVGGKAIHGAKTTTQAAKAAAKAGAIGGGVAGATQATGDADSTIIDNIINAGIGTGVGVGVGFSTPYGVQAVKGAKNLVEGGADRVLAGMGSTAAADKVAYRNIARTLVNQGYNPGEVAAIIDEFKAHGIKGGTLGQILESPDLLAREKNLLQGGGEAGKMMFDKQKAQPKEIAQSVVSKIKQYYQPDQTNYLYTQAGELADAAPPPGQFIDENSIGMGKSPSEMELPFTIQTIKQDLKQRAGELPSAVAKRIEKILNDVDPSDFLSADKAKQKLADLYKSNSQTTEQDIINEISEGYRRMLNDSLEQAGGDVYQFAKTSSKRDMAARDALEAFDTTNEGALKTALNRFFGSPEKKREFLDKLPDDATRREFEEFLNSIEKVSGKFGGSDTASNQATQKAMGAESGFGFEANILNPQSWVDRFAAPISKNVRKAQVKATFDPDVEKLQKAMTKPKYKSSKINKTAPIIANEISKQNSNQKRLNVEINRQSGTPMPAVDLPQVGDTVEIQPMSFQQPQVSGFDSAVDFVLKTEGGYVANDAGKGETNMGVNISANPDVDIKNLTQEKAKKLYKTRYWDAIKAENLPPEIATIAFDAAVNQGVGAAKRFIRAANGDPMKLLQLRKAHYDKLVKENPRKFKKYYTGWMSRLDELASQLA